MECLFIFHSLNNSQTLKQYLCILLCFCKKKKGTVSPELTSVVYLSNSAVIEHEKIMQLRSFT